MLLEGVFHILAHISKKGNPKTNISVGMQNAVDYLGFNFFYYTAVKLKMKRCLVLLT